ncbi:MAG: CDP-glucose 4,6-dehydratase [Chitinophagales bacterium]|nr:CDP-glucose 4,6-dehydratase [Sphingobacteriales bacterium]
MEFRKGRMEGLVKAFKGKKVFLTGHTGFKGSWMLQWLHSLGAIVKGYALVPENIQDLYPTINGDTLCESVIADIRDLNKLKSEIISFEPDFIFHLAAQPLVRYSYQFPVETFEVNVMGTANVLEAMRYLQKPVIGVMITTDKVYENKEWHYPYREVDRLGGYDPYSASKASAELVISSYRNSFFNASNFAEHKKSIASARAGNVIGGGDWAKDRIVPDIVRALSNGNDIEVRNPNAVRPWQHVLEPIGGYLQLAMRMAQNREKYNESWNFGPNADDTYVVEDLVKISIDIWGKGSYKKPELKDELHEAGLLKLDIQKSIQELKWKPKLNSIEAIKWTLDYYKSNDPILTMKKQISDYQNL